MKKVLIFIIIFFFVAAFVRAFVTQEPLADITINILASTLIMIVVNKAFLNKKRQTKKSL